MFIYLTRGYIEIQLDETVEDQNLEAFADAVVIRDIVHPMKTIHLNSDDIGRIESQNKDPEWQKRMIRHSNVYFARYLADSPNLTPEVQVELAKHSDTSAVTWLAKNPNLTPEVKTMVDRRLRKIK